MMNVFRRLKFAFSREFRPPGFFECRRCGTTVEHRTAACPACGSHEIASYRL